MVSKGFTFSNGKLNLQLSLDRELFYHGEEVRFNVNVKNDSKKTVKGLMVNKSAQFPFLPQILKIGNLFWQCTGGCVSER